MPRRSARNAAGSEQSSIETEMVSAMSPGRGEEKGAGRKRQHDEGVETAQAVDEVQGQSGTRTGVDTGRPRRAARKSFLLSSGDYQVEIPGIKVEEPDDSSAAVSSAADVVAAGPPSKQRRSAQNGTSANGLQKPADDAAGAKGKGGSGRVRSGKASLESGDATLKNVPQIPEQLEEVQSDQQLPQSSPPNPPNLQPVGSYALEMKVESMVGEDELTVEGEEEMITIDYEPQENEIVEEVVAGDYAIGEQPPSLERQRRLGNNSRGKSKRGMMNANETSNESPKTVREAVMLRHRHYADRALSRAVADRISTFNIKLFEDTIYETELGDAYATVIPGCLSYLLRKERIIDLLTSEEEVEHIRQSGWLIDRPPRLPPLVTHKVCFAFCVDGSKVQSIKDLSSDDLKPWSATDPVEGEPIVKPNVRKHPVQLRDGKFVIVKGEGKAVDYHLTEYSAWLPRLLRLRKKIFYVARLGRIYSNILILYDYTVPGEAPILLNNIPHGNSMLRSAEHTNMINGTMSLSAHSTLDESLVEDMDNPFEEEIVEGACQELFGKVKPSCFGWIYNKKLILRYLLNEPTIPEQMGLLNHKLPYLPPLVEEMSVFVYFTTAADVASHLAHSGDGLSPWTTNNYVPLDPNEPPPPRVRTNRRPLSQDQDGNYILATDQYLPVGLTLVETVTVLARCPRLRKRVLYVQKNNQTMVGNVIFVYEYLRDGPAPTIIKVNTRSIFRSNHALEKPIKTALKPMRSALTSNKLKDGQRGEETSEFVNVEELMDEEEEEQQREEMAGQPRASAGGGTARARVSRGEVAGTSGQAHQHEDMHAHATAVHKFEFEDDVMAGEDPDAEYMLEDTLNGGWDTEFEDDPLEAQENQDPYYEQPRALETGHVYLTVRHKRTACNFECILDYIANTTLVEDRQILNMSKPTHPPLVRNSRAYAFFVAGPAIFPFDINRDDFSPWSHNGTADNPTCYRTKVRKIGIVADPNGTHFELTDVDYKNCPFHLVYLYSINPRESRLRKKIYYMMDTMSRTVVSHALIIYDYHGEGSLPRLNGPYIKRFVKTKGLKDTPKGEERDPIARIHAQLAANAAAAGRPLQTVPMAMQLNAEMRNKLAVEGLWKKARAVFGTHNDDETFDCLWKMLLTKNEHRLLLNIKNDFGVEIVADYVAGEEIDYGATVEVDAEGGVRAQDGNVLEGVVQAALLEEERRRAAAETDEQTHAETVEEAEVEEHAEQREDEEMVAV